MRASLTNLRFVSKGPDGRLSGLTFLRNVSQGLSILNVKHFHFCVKNEREKKVLERINLDFV